MSEDKEDRRLETLEVEVKADVGWGLHNSVVMSPP
jgi:hypothetical protein